MGSGYWNMVPEPRKGEKGEGRGRRKKEEEESMGSGYWNMVPEPRKDGGRNILDEDKLRRQDEN